MKVYVLLRDSDKYILGVYASYGSARDEGDKIEDEHHYTCLVYEHDLHN